MNRLLLLLILTTSLFSCRNKAEEPAPEATAADSVAKTDSSEPAKSYLPVKALLQGEISNVESYAAGILRKANTKGKKDSAFVQLPRFLRTADAFLMKEFDSAYFRDNFQETSFMDQTTQLLNFIYTPKDSASSLQKVVVYVQPSETSAKMDRLYFETVHNQGDTLIEKRLTWKMRKYFYILTVKQPKTGDAITTMEKLIWDPQHFGDD